MTISLIIIICVLLLASYVFDITSAKTKVPSVILLILLGWLCAYLLGFFSVKIPDLSVILPILGTIGLVLIVLEGSLELELNRQKLPFIGKAFLVSLLPLLAFSLVFAWALFYFTGVSFKIALANAIPFAIISSAIAIPSARNLNASQKQFITYESSLSDIFGVLFFNFITSNDNIGTKSIGSFIIDIIIILVVSIMATLGLALLLSRIKHHVKFAPIILIIILIYAISKIYHLPALIFILLFGLFMGNLDELKGFKFIEKLKPDILDKEVHKFKELTNEITFLFRSLFFLLFGYLIKASELFNNQTIGWAVGIAFTIYLFRFLILRYLKHELLPILFVAPRGLITILLFLTIPAAQNIEIVNKSLIIQVITLTALVMMIGFMVSKNKKQ